MEVSEPQRPNVTAVEDPLAVKRYQDLKTLGREIFGRSETVTAGTIVRTDVELAREFLAKGIEQTRPPVRASYFEHVLIAPELGRRIAAAGQTALGVNPSEIEFLLQLHDIGRFVTPGEYIRNDLAGDRLLLEMGIPRSLIDKLPSVRKLMAAGEGLKLSEAQQKFQAPLTPEQEMIADAYFENQTPVQRIINYADNLGKRDAQGLFDARRFIQYLKTQEGRYGGTSKWASAGWAIPRRPDGTVLQAYLIERTEQWLRDNGIDLTAIHQDLQDFGPKFVIIVRHGELHNPSGRVYNRDSVMTQKDRIHLNERGREQMVAMGELLNKREYIVEQIRTSPEARARESAKALNKQLKVRHVAIDIGLDDVLAPGPIEERLTMEQLAQIGGDIYDEHRWGRYKHEQPNDVIRRMQQTFWDTAKNLKTGQTAVFVSHGDPIAWLVNTLHAGIIPDASDLRSLIYPAKGEGVLVIIGPDNKLFATQILATSSHKSTIY